MKITVFKFETVNGKKTGKSFGFYLDPKEMAAYRTKGALQNQIDEYVVKSGIFKKEELKDLKYNGMKEFLVEWKKQLEISKAEKQAKLEVSTNNPERFCFNKLFHFF